MAATSTTFLFFHLLLFSSFFTTSNASPEVHALMNLKSSLDPENVFLFSWKNDGDPCGGEFEGVACDTHGKVTNISLQGKGLYGFISPAVAELRSLSGLFLHYNALTGKIPQEIGNLRELSDLYLNNNNLSGRVPVEIGKMAGLQVLQLCYNKLTGSIPTQLGGLKKLNVLALQSNHLTGAIPASLGDLTELIRIDLSTNHLFGSIPGKLADMPQLMILDVQNNSLSGNVPPEFRRLEGGFRFGNNSGLCGTGFSDLRACTSADLLNPNRPEPYGKEDSNGIPQKIIPQSANTKIHSHSTTFSNKSKVPFVYGIMAVVFGTVVCSLLAFTWYRRRKQKIGSSLDVSDSRLSIDLSKDVYQKKCSSPLMSLEYSNGWDPLSDGRSGVGFSEEVSQSFRFNLEEVEFATQYFSEINLLGRSNFASTYKGILRDGSVVAVKSIYKTSCKTEETEFLKGLKVLTALRHDNLVGLRGFCCSRSRGECFLVYDFVANGSLSHYLDAKKDDENPLVLDWPTRVSIIKGIAKGIEYLHASRPNKPSLVHQNISAENVLIDHHFKPLLSGSGLHKLLADDVVFSSLKASAAMGYLAPEYTTTGRFTEKSDAYAFGMIIFQVLSGKLRMNHLKLGNELEKLEDLIDNNLNENFSKPEAAKLAGIALICTAESPTQRPTMDAVLQELSCGRS